MMGSEHDVINNISSQIEIQMEKLEARKSREERTGETLCTME